MTIALLLRAFRIGFRVKSDAHALTNMQSRVRLYVGVMVPLLLLGHVGLAATASVTIDGSVTYQVIEGFGVNANHRSWNNTELQPVLDALIDQGGMTLFRVVFDKSDWEATNDNSNPNVMNWTYYNQVYSAIRISRSYGGYRLI